MRTDPLTILDALRSQGFWRTSLNADVARWEARVLFYIWKRGGGVRVWGSERPISWRALCAGAPDVPVGMVLVQ